MEGESPALITLTAMSKSFRRLKRRADAPWCSLVLKLRSYNKEDFVNDEGFESFFNKSITALKKHAPQKKKFAIGNLILFMTIGFSGETVKRWKLCKYLFEKYEPKNNEC